MQHLTNRITFGLSLLTGLLLIFIGVRFLLIPETAETAFGISVNTQGDYSFHYIKGARDIFSGLILLILLLTKEIRALGIVLLCSPIIPAIDCIVVLSHANYETNKLYPHLTAVLIGIGLGVYYLYVSHTQRKLDRL